MHLPTRSLALFAVLSFTLVYTQRIQAEPPTPPNLAASSVVLLVNADGRVYASGESDSERGDTSEQPRNYFLPIEGLKGIHSVYLPFDAWDSAVAIDRTHQVWLWGRAWSELLHGEDAKPAFFCKPTHVPSLDGTVAMDLSDRHLIALDKNGSVRTMATSHCGNETGFLGSGKLGPHKGPVKVAIDDAVQVAVGPDTSFVLRANGTVWGMGSGAAGLLGSSAQQGSYFEVDDDAKNANPRPIAIQGLRNIAAISMSTRFGIALDKTGDVWGWGINDSGQLGTNSDELATRRPQRIRGLKKCVAIAAGYDFMLALLKDGTVMAQGCNVYGALGDNRGELEGGLRQIRLPGPATRIYAGQYNAFAELTDGRLVGWGANAPTVGGFHPQALLTAIPPTPLDVELRPLSTEIIRSGGAAVILRRDGDSEAPERYSVLVDDSTVGAITVTPQQAVDEFRFEISSGAHRYRIKGISDAGPIDNQGVVFVSAEPMEIAFAKSVKEQGMIAAIQSLKQQIKQANPALKLDALDVRSSGPMIEEAIKQCETQLGKPLPKSYRRALKTIGPFQLGPAKADLPVVGLYKPDTSWTIGTWMEKAIKSSQQGSNVFQVPSFDEEYDIYLEYLRRPAATLLRRQQLLVGAVNVYDPYVLSPTKTCEDGSMARLWPEMFRVDEDPNEPTFSWQDERDCELVMLDKMLLAVSNYVAVVCNDAGIAFVVSKPDGSPCEASINELENGDGFGIFADGWME